MSEPTLDEIGHAMGLCDHHCDGKTHHPIFYHETAETAKRIQALIEKHYIKRSEVVGLLPEKGEVNYGGTNPWGVAYKSDRDAVQHGFNQAITLMEQALSKEES